jgi:ABC-type lipoprotein release transport system permease subunit
MAALSEFKTSLAGTRHPVHDLPHPTEQAGLIITLAFRNLFRNVRRTVITATGVVAGVAIMIMGWALVGGLDENVIRAQEDAVTGHVLLRPADYPDDGFTFPIKEAKPLPASLRERLEGPEIKAWTTRIWFMAKAINGPDAVRIKVIGYDPERDPEVFDRSHWTTTGAWPEAPGQIAIGSGLKDLLDLDTGQQVLIEARTLPGAINALPFTITGIVQTNTTVVDGLGVWMPLETADQMVLMNRSRSHVAVRLDNRSGADAAAQRLDGEDWRAVTASWEARDLLEINRFRRKALSVVVFVLMAIAGAGIANTVIMAAYERVREIGTLRALGLSQGGIRSLFLLEGAALGVMAGLVGAALGCAVVLYFAEHGIDLGMAANKAGDVNMSTMLYMRLSVPSVYGSVGFGFAISVLASLYPAAHAAQLNPAEAVRAT